MPLQARARRRSRTGDARRSGRRSAVPASRARARACLRHLRLRRPHARLAARVPPPGRPRPPGTRRALRAPPGTPPLLSRRSRWIQETPTTRVAQMGAGYQPPRSAWRVRPVGAQVSRDVRRACSPRCANLAATEARDLLALFVTNTIWRPDAWRGGSPSGGADATACNPFPSLPAGLAAGSAVLARGATGAGTKRAPGVGARSRASPGCSRRRARARLPEGVASGG